MKNFVLYIISILVVLFLVFSTLFGALIQYHYTGGTKYKYLQEKAIFFASIPFVLKKIIDNKSFNIDKPPILKKNKNKKNYVKYNEKNRNGLLVLPRYDNSLGRSLVEIIDLNTFEIIHSYLHDIDKMNALVKNKKEFPRLEIDNSQIRFLYIHPLILDDGTLVSSSNYAQLFKIDFCSNLKWINDEEVFHHSKMLNHENNIWVAGQMKPYSKYFSNLFNQDFQDDAIIKINSDGEILFKKSVSEILLENKIWDDNQINLLSNNIRNKLDPIHLNDIEPIFFDSKYWKKGDVFLSLRHQSSVIHYRPDENKIINYITGPFSQQHDVDIISQEEIMIFNNNNFVTDNEFSEILIYNFKTKKFKKLLQKQLKKEKFKTYSGGVAQMLKDGSIMVDEHDHGRIIFFDNKGIKEWEYTNKDKNGDINLTSWPTIIEDEDIIQRFKELKKNTKCTN